jgi:hypothetical protein
MAIPNGEQTLRLLRAEKHYPIRIKPEKNNPNYVTEAVYVNGECIQIPVGEDVEVPETVYKLLTRKGVI